MIVNLVSKFRMQWFSGYMKVFGDDLVISETPIASADVYLFMWCDKETREFINNNPKKAKYVVFIRRYEYYTVMPENIDWSKVDALVMVNDFLAEGIEKRIGVKPTVIYNGILPEEWTYKERKHGNKIAVVGFINQKKNLPLAMQVLLSLPIFYELHFTGALQDGATYDYIVNIARTNRRKVHYHGHLDDLNQWYDIMDINYILSTAISEGCPNNIMEAMAKGIKPIVHNWPGSLEQYNGFTFTEVSESLSMFHEYSPYDSAKYRDYIVKERGEEQFHKVRRLVEGLCHSN